jgi:hypothetical protein
VLCAAVDTRCWFCCSTALQRRLPACEPAASTVPCCCPWCAALPAGEPAAAVSISCSSSRAVAAIVCMVGDTAAMAAAVGVGDAGADVRGCSPPPPTATRSAPATAAGDPCCRLGDD